MKLSNCPICGHTPIIDKESLNRGNGRGYPGHHEYYIKCSNKDCPLSRKVSKFTYDDIYSQVSEVNSYLCETWNEESKKIDELIAHRND